MTYLRKSKISSWKRPIHVLRLRLLELCVIMGLLDMKELLGAATVIESLLYGAERVQGPSQLLCTRELLSELSICRLWSITGKEQLPCFPLPSTSCNCSTARQCFSLVQDTSTPCENHVRRLRTFFTVVLEPNIHTFSVLSETLPDFLKSKLC